MVGLSILVWVTYTRAPPHPGLVGGLLFWLPGWVASFVAAGWLVVAAATHRGGCADNFMPKTSHQNDGNSMTTLTLRLRGLQAEIVDRMVEAGLAETKSEAVRIALLQFGRSAGLIDEKALHKALQKAAAEKPLTDAELIDGIRRSKRARLPRR